MKDLEGSASTTVAASQEECIALLAAVDRYPSWYPAVIRAVEVLERDDHGVPRRARTTVHLTMGPVSRDFEFEVVVEVGPSSVVLSKVAGSAADHEQLELSWGVSPEELRLHVSARLSVPRLMPVGGAGNSVAQGFVAAAKRELEGSSPKASASSS